MNLLNFWFPPQKVRVRPRLPELQLDVVYTVTKDGRITWYGEDPPYFWLGADAGEPAQ